MLVVAASQAQVVFQALDCDDSGSISVKELGDVLTSWALPEGEAAQYMKRMDTGQGSSRAAGRQGSRTARQQGRNERMRGGGQQAPRLTPVPP